MCFSPINGLLRAWTCRSESVCQEQCWTLWWSGLRSCEQINIFLFFSWRAETAAGDREVCVCVCVHWHLRAQREPSAALLLTRMRWHEKLLLLVALLEGWPVIGHPVLCYLYYNVFRLYNWTLTVWSFPPSLCLCHVSHITHSFCSQNKIIYTPNQYFISVYWFGKHSCLEWDHVS